VSAPPKILVCFACRNLEDFLQVTDRGDARTIGADGTELTLGPFQPLEEDRDPGLYCAVCGEGVEIDGTAFEELSLRDLRVNLLPFDEFNGRSFAEELKRLVPSAEWTEYDEPATRPTYAELDHTLDPRVSAALGRTGLDRFFTHQARGIDVVLDRNNVVLVTPAGSGKSLVYQTAILQTLVNAPGATALVIAPMKALTADQLAQMARFSESDPWTSAVSLELALGSGARTIHISRYDGGVDNALRVRARERGDVLFATPDSLHHSILMMARKTYKSAGKGTRWYRFLSGLRYVVVDEMHIYRGVFGANVAQVLRRLRRITEYWGLNPTFVMCSATIGNPLELAQQLTGLDDFTVIDQDSSGHGRRIHLICNPPLESEKPKKKKSTESVSMDGRVSPQTIMLDLLAKGALAREGLPVSSLAFGRSRGEVFALGTRLRNRLIGDHRRRDLADAVATYASVLLAEDRATVETRLREGSVAAIIGTNALELGIDIPHLSFGLLAGYPGQRATFRQRAGRVGRRGEGVVVTVVGDDPLQQFVARNPSVIFEGRPEDVVVNAAAPKIVENFGLEPGEQELEGICLHDAAYWPEDDVRAWIEGLPRSRMRWDSVVSRAFYHRLDSYEGVYRNLRDISGTSYTVYSGSKRSPKPIGVIDAASAARDCFVPAIFPTYNGDLYRVYDFDHRERSIYAERAQTSYLTRGVPIDTLEIVAEQEARSVAGMSLAHGRIRVSRRVFSYKVLHNAGGEETKQVEKGWPSTSFETQALWLDPLLNGIANPSGALVGMEHVLLSIAPLVVAVDPFDFESATENHRVFIYESFADGMGLAKVAFDRMEELLDQALDVINSCGCSEGCPGCVHLPRRPDGNEGVDKKAAGLLLASVAASRLSE
jgi:DEAD/DEAH box helicase domain-containing protein